MVGIKFTFFYRSKDYDAQIHQITNLKWIYDNLYSSIDHKLNNPWGKSSITW